MPTLSRSAHVFGGFSIYAEAAPDEACGDRSGILPIGHDVTPMASGEVLRGPGLRVSGNQIWWKPFFVPLSQPLRIRASGEVQPRRGATATGPNGIAVPDAPRWLYPGTPDVVVDNHAQVVPAGPAVSGADRAAVRGDGMRARFPGWRRANRVCKVTA